MPRRVKALRRTARWLFGGLLAACCATTGWADPPRLWFYVGERITYDMRWGLIPVGTTVVESEWAGSSNAPLLRIRFTTRTNRLFDKLYRVDDTVESLIDPVTFLPILFTKDLREGTFKDRERTMFDRKHNTVRWESLTDGQSREYSIDPGTRDIVSLMFLLRQKEFRPHETNAYVVAGDQGYADVNVVSLDLETLALGRYGRVEALRIRPHVSEDTLFQRKVPQEVWISMDPRRLLVQMKVDVPVGHITLELSNVEGPGDDAWVHPAQGDAEEQNAP